jgi:hypothetical protein
MGLLALVALAGGVAWYLAFRPHPPHSPVAWYARVVSAAVFVGHEQHLSRKHPVTVSFLADGAFQARFGESLAAARPGPGPAGTGLAQYVSSADTIFVRGTSVDFLTRYALVGQLVEALRGQYASGADAAQAQAAYVRSLTPAQVQTLRAEQARGR